MAATIMSYQETVVAGGISGRGMEICVLKQLGKPRLEPLGPLRKFLM